MKLIMKILGGIVFLFSLVFFVQEKTIGGDSWKNYFGISYLDTPSNRIKYAKQMGYDYIGIKGTSWDTSLLKAAMTNQGVTGLKFLIIDPYFSSAMMALSPAVPDYSIIEYVPGSDGGRNINPSHTYTQAQKDWYNSRMAWGTMDAWPNNFATGWYYSIPDKIFSVIWDFQQQVVIDEMVSKIIAMMHSCEDNTLNFKCAGYMVDVATLEGDFHKPDQSQTTISFWTGNDSCLLHSGITHEYPTYQDGVAAFYKQLRTAMVAAFPGAKWVIDPARIYATPSMGVDEWVYKIKDRPDKNELTPDLLMQEGGTTDFVDQPLNFNSGVNITKDMVGSHQRTKVDESTNRLIAAKAGINGAWYNWFMLFGYYNPAQNWTMPGFQSITDVYPRLKLVRCIPNWDNLNSVPLTNRSWDGIVYQSPKSYISSDVMYSRHPKTGKLFAVFLTTNGLVKLNGWESVASVKRTDGFFMESTDGSADFDIVDNTIRLKSGVNIAVDASNGQVKGNGYIFTLLSKSGVPVVLQAP